MYDGLPELTIEDRHQRAWVLFWLERYEAAERECRTIIQQKIDSVDAWELLAHIKARSGKFREAAEIYKQLLKQERSAQGKKPD